MARPRDPYGTPTPSPPAVMAGPVAGPPAMPHPRGGDDPVGLWTGLPRVRSRHAAAGGRSATETGHSNSYTLGMSAIIRSATEQDSAAIELIENDADVLFIERFQPTDWPGASPAAERVEEPGFLLVAALDGERIAGFVHVLEVNGLCHVEQLSIAPVHARQGAGRALLEAAKQGAVDRGYHWISLRTYAHVPWNGPFYSTAGFREALPETAFHRSLVEVDATFGLDTFGRRIHMTANLS